MKAVLLRNKPYKLSKASPKYDHVKVQLNPQCGLKPDEYVYEARKPNGVIEIIPAKIWEQVKKYYI